MQLCNIKLVIVYVFITFAPHLHAQEPECLIMGTIQDAYLGIPVSGAKVKLMTQDSTVVNESVKVKELTNIHGDIKQVQFILRLPVGKKYLLQASLEGYDDGWVTFETKAIENGIEMLPPLELRRTISANINQVTVTATKVKMYYKGDTLVYNADAFKLPEGAMLDALIKQLPGVTMDEYGQIFVNGRLVEELLLGSRSFFRGNNRVLMENLPYYTVKDIKVYEQQSDANIAMGFDVERNKYVMDVNLKPEYSRGIIGNTEVAAGTENRYLARAFLLGFADPYRFTLLGNINNVNESRQIGESGHWRPASIPRSLQDTRSIGGELDYQTNNQEKDQRIKNNLHIDFTTTDEEIEIHQYRETFLNGSTPSSKQHSSSIAKAEKLNIQNRFTFYNPGKYVNVNAGYNQNNYLGNTALLSEQFHDTLLTRMQKEGFEKGRSWSVHLNTMGRLNTDYNSKQYKYLLYELGIGHNSNEQEQVSGFTFEKPLKNKQHNINDIRHRNTEVDASASYGLSRNSVVIDFGGSLILKNEKKHDYLYHPDTLLLPSQIDALLDITDRNNSYDSHHKKQRYFIDFNARKEGSSKPNQEDSQKHKYQMWNFNLKLGLNHQSLNYQRGSLDTLANKTSLSYHTEFNYRLFPTKDPNKELTLGIASVLNDVSLYDRISYRDDATPLVVKLGNPNLKGYMATIGDIDFYRRKGNNQLQYHLSAHFVYRHNMTAQSVNYNPNTGVYTYKPVNVKGNYMASGTFDISSALDEKRYWTWQMNVNMNYNHSIDHTMFEGDTESYINKVNTLTLSDNAYIQFQKGNLNVRVTGDVAWRHSEGRMRDFKSLNALDFNYGLSARYTLPILKTTVTTDATMFSRCGYGTSMLNTDDFILNASVSQPFMKGKLIARIEAFDLLHNLSSSQYEVNAQGRTETWYRSLPHYAMLHLVYHWNRNPKRK